MIRERAIVFVLGFLSWVFFSNSAIVFNSKPSFYTYKLQPHTEAQWSLLRTLVKDSDSYALLNQPDSNSDIIFMLVSPEKVWEFQQEMKDVGMIYTFFERSEQAETEVQAGGGVYNWKQYHTLNDTYDWLRSLSKLYPEQANLFVAGRSYEGRDLLGIRISYGEDKKAIFLEGGIHAREWISPATVTFIANQLLTSQREDIRTIAENFDWYILPHANPDGYVYSYTTDRLWRKTRSPQANGCYGVDLNRNWDFNWNEMGTGNDPCGITYAGPKPFSEIEARTLANYLTKLKGRLFLYVGFHSYRQKLLYPYAYSPKLPSNNADYKRVYNAAIAGLARRYGTKYTGGNVFENMYPAAGASIDWVYDVVGVNYSFVYELCPLNSNYFGFRLPASNIIPTGEETLDSLVEMVKEAGTEWIDVTARENNSAESNKIPSVKIFLAFYVFLVIRLL